MTTTIPGQQTLPIPEEVGPHTNPGGTGPVGPDVGRPDLLWPSSWVRTGPIRQRKIR